MGDEGYLLHPPRGVTINDGIFFGVQTSTYAWIRAVTIVGQAACIAVVTHCQHLAVIGAGDDGPHLQPAATGAFGHQERKAHVDFFESGTHRNVISFS